MFKIARKPSADPIQEKLRQDKASWNATVSAFISDLIHAKKLLNGAPNKFNKTKSSIQNPIPADPATIINSLAGDFQEISQSANKIIQEQIEYSKNRRQRQIKQPAAQPTSPGNLQAIEPDKAPVDLNKQLAAWQTKYDYQLIAEASNPFSRFIAHLLTPQIGFGEGARIRRLRMPMLDNCVKAYKELKQLQKQIVGSSKSSIQTSHKMMTTIFHHWNAVNRLFSTYQNMRPAPAQDDGGEIKPPKNTDQPDDKKDNTTPSSDTNAPNNGSQAIEQAQLAVSDIQANSNSFSMIPGMQQLRTYANQFSRAEPEQQRSLVDVLLAAYRQVIGQICQEKKLPPQDSLADILAMGTKSPTKTAQLQRWLGKIRHQILPGATSGPRLEMYRLIENTKQDLNKVMDLLEKGFDENLLSSAIKDVNQDISQMRIMMRSLYFSEQPYAKSKPGDNGGGGGMLDMLGY